MKGKKTLLQPSYGCNAQLLYSPNLCGGDVTAKHLQRPMGSGERKGPSLPLVFTPAATVTRHCSQSRDQIDGSQRLVRPHHHPPLTPHHHPPFAKRAVGLFVVDAIDRLTTAFVRTGAEFTAGR